MPRADQVGVRHILRAKNCFIFTTPQEDACPRWADENMQLTSLGTVLEMEPGFPLQSVSLLSGGILCVLFPERPVSTGTRHPPTPSKTF